MTPKSGIYTHWKFSLEYHKWSSKNINWNKELTFSLDFIKNAERLDCLDPAPAVLAFAIAWIEVESSISLAQLLGAEVCEAATWSMTVVSSSSFPSIAVAKSVGIFPFSGSGKKG
jgi:hypothetical protein